MVIRNVMTTTKVNQSGPMKGTRTSQEVITIPGMQFVKALGGISECTLKSNGLRILLAPDDSVPVAGCMVTYHVGSRNEAVGYTGATHLLEHLLFKGTSKFKAGTPTSMDLLLESKGAKMNASTWLDRTDYHEIVPKGILPLAIEIEADRMRTAVFTIADKESEMPVVRNEFEKKENSPFGVLNKEIWATAFLAHPYHHPTLGWLSDVENITIERLQQFYNDFYWPNNATITIVGSFEVRNVLSLIKKFFGIYPRSPHVIPIPTTKEPPQQGQRRTTINRTGTNTIGISFKIPPAAHEDVPALIVLSDILSGDKTSRLYKRFIDSAFATSVSAWCNQMLDESLFQIFVTLSPNMTHVKAEKILFAELDAIKELGITAQELSQVKIGARNGFASRRDGAYAFLDSMNEDIAAGDWTRFVTLPEAIKRVTAADIKRVVRKYFVQDQSIVGWFVAKNK